MTIDPFHYRTPLSAGDPHDLALQDRLFLFGLTFDAKNQKNATPFPPIRNYRNLEDINQSCCNARASNGVKRLFPAPAIGFTNVAP
jgi:hypothetical protein